MPIQPLTIAMLSIHSSPTGVLGTRDTGGMSVYVRQLAREMGRIGHQVDIFTRCRQDENPEVAVIAPNVRLIMLAISHRGPLAKDDLFYYGDDYRASIETFCRDEQRRFDLIHSHYWLSGQVGCLLAAAWHLPHVITFHTLGVLKAGTGVGPAESERRLAVENKLVKDCDGLLVACEGEKSNLMHYYSAGRAAIALVPGGVDLETFRPMQKARARQQLELDPGCPWLLSVGRLTPLKGQDRIIHALARLKQGVRPRLIIVGGDGSDDAERQHLQNVAIQIGVQSRVHFAGNVAHRDLPTYYAAADIFVLASHYESFGLVGLEALACGRPVVSSPVGVMNDLGRMGRAGVVVTDGSPDALAKAIDAAIKRAPDWPAQVIRDTARKFSWQSAAVAAIDAYQNVLMAHTASHGDAI